MINNLLLKKKITVFNFYVCIEDIGYPCIGVAVRLVGGSSYNEGRVELYYNYRWGTVCDDRWDDTDAGVVCRQLGFGSSGTAIKSAGFGQGSGSIWLDSVTCTGNESTLASCGHLGVGISRNCYEVAGVRCTEIIRESILCSIHTCVITVICACI